MLQEYRSELEQDAVQMVDEFVEITQLNSDDEDEVFFFFLHHN